MQEIYRLNAEKTYHAAFCFVEHHVKKIHPTANVTSSRGHHTFFVGNAVDISNIVAESWAVPRDFDFGCGGYWVRVVEPHVQPVETAKPLS